MGDGVDDWLILTAIQKSLIDYTLKKQFILLIKHTIKFLYVNTVYKNLSNKKEIDFHLSPFY